MHLASLCWFELELHWPKMLFRWGANAEIPHQCD